MFKFHFILEYFNFKLSICWAQFDVFGVKSKGFGKIGQIRLFRQGILENLSRIKDYTPVCRRPQLELSHS